MSNINNSLQNMNSANNNFSLLHINSRSINNNFDSVEIFLKLFKQIFIFGNWYF